MRVPTGVGGGAGGGQDDGFKILNREV